MRALLILAATLSIGSVDTARAQAPGATSDEASVTPEQPPPAAAEPPPAPPPPTAPANPPTTTPPAAVPVDPVVEERGTIFGDLIDADGGAPVAGVTVTATSNHHVEMSGASDASGRYRIEGLPVGTYALSFHKDGRAAEPIANIDLRAGVTLRYDAVIYGDGAALAEPRESPKEKRKRERRERWRELAGLLGDKPKDAPTPEERAQKKRDKAQEGWKLKPPDLKGFVQVHFRQPFFTGADPAVDFNDFRVQRVRIGADGEVFPWLGYTVEIDPRAPEVTGLLRDAYLELKGWHQRLRLGQQKTAFGYENFESSTELWAVNRSEMADNIARANNLRDTGLGLIGFIPLGGGFRIENAVTVTNGAGLNVQADNTAAKNVWGRLGGRFDSTDLGDLEVKLGGSGGFGDFIDCVVVEAPGLPCTVEADPTAEEVVFRRLGVDLEIDQQWFFVGAEYGYAWDIVAGEADERAGYYVTVVGKTPWSVGPMVRYDAVGDEFQRATFGAYWGMPNDLLRVMVNYELRLKKDNVRADDKLFIWAQVEF